MKLVVSITASVGVMLGPNGFYAACVLMLQEPQAEPTVEEDLGPYMKTPLCTYCGHTGDVLDLSWSKVFIIIPSWNRPLS